MSTPLQAFFHANPSGWNVSTKLFSRAVNTKGQASALLSIRHDHEQAFLAPILLFFRPKLKSLFGFLSEGRPNGRANR